MPSMCTALNNSQGMANKGSALWSLQSSSMIQCRTIQFRTSMWWLTSFLSGILHRIGGFLLFFFFLINQWVGGGRTLIEKQFHLQGLWQKTQISLGWIDQGGKKIRRMVWSVIKDFRAGYLCSEWRTGEFLEIMSIATL